MNIAVFCAANDVADENVLAATRELGEWMGKNKHTLVYGGVNCGLMEVLAEAVKRSGGRTIGVVPSILDRNGRASSHVDIHIPCDNLSDRKELMLLKSDVAVALPGGVGTLDEVFSQVASASVGYHTKPVLMYNIQGFWEPLRGLLNRLRVNGMLRNTIDSQLMFVDNLPMLVRLLEIYST